MENLYQPDCIRTYTGVYIDVFNPKIEQIKIADIAHSLSNQCRFAGHLPYFYSVAQHSINCAYIVSPTHKLAALLHDAAEAYILDVPKPIKSRMPIYNELEDNLMRLIAEKFGFEYPLDKAVKDADKIALEWEWRKLMLKGNNGLIDPLKIESTFMETFNQLTK